MAEKLDAGESLPETNLKLPGGATMRVPEDVTTSYGVVLFYRGHW